MISLTSLKLITVLPVNRVEPNLKPMDPWLEGRQLQNTQLDVPSMLERE